MKLDLQKIEQLIDQKLIRKQKHPTEDLWIYNYTEKCQYDCIWTEETMMCRGLIADKDGNIIARPFKKFFNYGEYKGEIPNEDFEVFEKYDGSLGILYWIGDTLQIATRGSFDSEQALVANTMIGDNIDVDKLDKTKTYLVEIIYPQNRIVVDYGVFTGLVLLAIVDTETGREYEVTEDEPFKWKASKLSGINKIEQIK